MKLYAFPKQLVTKKLRDELSAHEMIFFVQMLRIELQDGGWISRYVDAGPAKLRQIELGLEGEDNAVAAGPSDSAMAIVAGLLSCAIDAMGLGGWLNVGNTTGIDSADQLDDDDPRELLGMLRNDISAALEGIHECIVIRQALGDFFRYGASVEQSARPPNLPTWNKRAKEKGELTKPVTLIDDGATGLDAQIGARMKWTLPLGLRAENKRVNATKVVSGGEIRTKSRRQVGMEISKRVGRYSFERIRV